MNGNFNVRCVKSNQDWFTTGKIYEIKNGKITDDDGEKYPLSNFLENIEQLKVYAPSNEWELVAEKQHVGEYISIKRCKKDKRVIAIMSMDGVFQKSANVKLNDFNGDFEKAVKAAVDKLTSIDSKNEPVEIKPDIIIGNEPSCSIIKQDKYEVGDRVKVKKDLYKMAVDSVFNLWTDMCRFSENIVTITEAKETEWGMRYSIEGSPRSWIAECFEGKVMEDTTVNSFDWESFKSGKFAVHCDTEEKARAFMKECDEHGIKWSGGDKASKRVHVHGFAPDRCYNLNNLKYITVADVAYYTKNGFTIIAYPPSKPTVNEVKRIAQPNEWIRIVSPIYNGLVSEKDYRKGDVLKVRKRESIRTLTTYGHDGKPINDTEYVVLEGYTPEDKPAVKEVRRPAKVGEWIKIVESDTPKYGNYAPGDIILITKIYDASVVEGNNRETVCRLMEAEYIVLENYQPEVTEETKPIDSSPDKLFKKAKAGDKIKIVNAREDHGPIVKNGDIQTVDRVKDDSVGTKEYNWFYDKNQEYIIIEEAQEAPAPEATPVIKIGDTVKVINRGNCYTSYPQWFDDYAVKYASRYSYGNPVCGGFIGKVVAKHEHGDRPNVMLYAIQRGDSAVYLVSEKGIEKINQ